MVTILWADNAYSCLAVERVESTESQWRSRDHGTTDVRCHRRARISARLDDAKDDMEGNNPTAERHHGALSPAYRH